MQLSYFRVTFEHHHSHTYTVYRHTTLQLWICYTCNTTHIILSTRHHIISYRIVHYSTTHSPACFHTYTSLPYTTQHNHTPQPPHLGPCITSRRQDQTSPNIISTLLLQVHPTPRHTTPHHTLCTLHITLLHP